MAKDLLLEIGIEEAPASFLTSYLDEYKEKVAAKLKEERIQCEEVKTLGTPRRITLILKGLAEMQEDVTIENRGPKKAAAFDKDGNPTKAVLGFSRGQGVDVKDLEVREVGGTEYMFAVKSNKGEATEKIIADLILNSLWTVNMPKSMRWAYHPLRFIRPIRWILALYGTEVLPLSVQNITSGSVTYGHRFLAPQAVEIHSAAEYEDVLKEKYVIVDQNKRKALIWEQVQAVAASVNGTAHPDEDLLEQLTNLVEYPTAFYGEFSPSYLEVPVEVLTTSMIENQKYFPVFGADEKLLPGFIGVRNGTDYSIDVVKAGNQRVIKARLEDALFFWKEDTKRKLEEYTAKFAAVTFHEKLGSLEAKVERLKKLAVYTGAALNLSTPADLERAAYLCKADLMTSMVYEFTELQGVMGRYYAQISGENTEVSEAILEHYMPRFAGDTLPQTKTGIALALAEKIDNITGCFMIGIKPSGSQDPYALRRQALGIVNIVLENALTLDLRAMVKASYDGFVNVKAKVSADETAEQVVDFIAQRLRGVLLDRGYTYDVVDAVLALRGGDIQDDFLKVQAVASYRQNETAMENFMTVFNRSNNLSKKWDKREINREYFKDPTEEELYIIYTSILPQIAEHEENTEYVEIMECIGRMRYALDKFFDAVMVMDKDPNVKATRLGLLKSIADLTRIIADFSLLTD